MIVDGKEHPVVVSTNSWAEASFYPQKTPKLDKNFNLCCTKWKNNIHFRLRTVRAVDSTITIENGYTWTKNLQKDECGLGDSGFQDLFDNLIVSDP